MITIRPVKDVADCLHIEAISLAAWGENDKVVPDHLLITIAKNNGCVLLAWDDAKPVGFCFSFATFVGDRADGGTVEIKHHSHIAAVLPAYQGRGIGSQLKWAQRDFVLAQGINRITWTFDPLETLNGRLNIRRLGSVCNTYQRNVYGIGYDALSLGMQTDRLQVDWWLASEHVAQHQAESYEWISAESIKTIPSLNQIKNRTHPDSVHLDRLKSNNRVRIAVPNQFQALKSQDLELAKTWRLHTRTLFEAAFSADFTVTDLLTEPHCSYYLLEKNWRQ